MPPPYWEYEGQVVLDEVSKAPPAVRTDFIILLDKLTKNPRDKRYGVRPLRTAAGGYTAPFDAAVLVYQVLADYGRIRLLLVAWEGGTPDKGE